MTTITKDLLKSWRTYNLIPDELLPMDVMGLFEAPITPRDKIWILLHEEVLGGRGMVYVAARAARRACTQTGWSNPDSLRALDLCDRYAEGGEIPKEELAKVVQAADEVVRTASDSPRAAWGAAWATSKAAWAADAAVRVAPIKTDAWAAVEAAVKATSIEEVGFQLDDCREWLSQV
jgi:hypothetical protein